MHTMHAVIQFMHEGEQRCAGFARRTNDFLAEKCAKHKGRFSGFAAIPMQDPQAAARELERAATRLETCAQQTQAGDRDPTPAQVWQKLAETRLVLQQKDLARAACMKGLAAEPNHRGLTELLRQLDAAAAGG